MAKKTAVAKKQKTAIVKQDASVLLAQHSGDGLDDMTIDDLAIPFVRILQGRSPQVIKTNADYIKGAEEGDIFNSATGALYKKGIRVVPVAFKKIYIEWRPRIDGGGYIATHDPRSEFVKKTLGSGAKNDKGKPLTDAGNELIETAQYYVLAVSDKGGSEKAVITMVSTQLKKSRRWNSMIASRTLEDAEGREVPCPVFGASYMLTTKGETYAGGDCMGWVIECVGPMEDVPVLQQAIDMRKGLDAVKVDYNQMQDGGPSVATPVSDVF